MWKEGDLDRVGQRDIESGCGGEEEDVERVYRMWQQ